MVDRRARVGELRHTPTCSPLAYIDAGTLYVQGVHDIK